MPWNQHRQDRRVAECDWFPVRHHLVAARDWSSGGLAFGLKRVEQIPVRRRKKHLGLVRVLEIAGRAEVIRVSVRHDDVAYFGMIKPERFETGKKDGLDLLRVSGIDQNQPFAGFKDVNSGTDAP